MSVNTARTSQRSSSAKWSEPAERFYGIEAMFQDDSGNWLSLTQRK